MDENKYAPKEEPTKHTIVAPCSCYSVFQDKRYGKGMRLHNPTIRLKTRGRCTVCGKEK